MYGIFDISTSALVAQRTNIDIIAGNIANKDVTRGTDGSPSPFRRRVAMFSSGRTDGGPGVHIDRIMEDPSPFRLRHDPDHPDALKDGPNKGYVQLPNVDEHTEMVNALVAVRAYEANITVMEAIKAMTSSTMRLLA